MFFLLFLTSFIAIADDLSERVEEIRLKNNVPALTAAYYKHGSAVEVIAKGVRKLGNTASVKTTDKFHIGSCTKAMTATVAAKLVEEGVLNWNDPIGELLPDIIMSPVFADISFEKLLNHHSGLPKDPAWEDYLKWSELEIFKGRKAMVSSLLQESTKQKPGVFVYSNVGYITAGLIMERLTGKSWEVLMQEKLFSPLGMKSCGFGLTSKSSETSPTAPWGHLSENGKITPSQTDNAAYYGPAGTVHCSLGDWAKFLNEHIKGFHGESSFLNKMTFRKLHEVTETSSYTYGGWVRLDRKWAGGSVLTHDGSNVRNFAVVWLAPLKKSFIISTANVGGEPGSKATDQVAGLLVEKFYQ